MDKLSKSVEVLKLLSTTTSETLIIKGNNENDYNAPLTVEENLNQLVKVLEKNFFYKFLLIIKHNSNVGLKALKGYFFLFDLNL
ncbi:unnamed protein product [Rotaria sp. Silwood2]|nr:unnamed protein product [Rotaria sp. Silwood2]